MRVPRSGTDGEPPLLGVGLLAELGAYVFTNASPFGAGHRLDPGGPITGSAGTRLSAVAFTEDRLLPAVHPPAAPCSSSRWWRITDDELVGAGDVDRQVLRRLSLHSPDLVRPGRWGKRPAAPRSTRVVDAPHASASPTRPGSGTPSRRHPTP